MVAIGHIVALVVLVHNSHAQQSHPVVSGGEQLGKFCIKIAVLVELQQFLIDSDGL